MALDNWQIYEALSCAISNAVLSGYTDTNIKSFLCNKYKHIASEYEVSKKQFYFWKFFNQNGKLFTEPNLYFFQDTNHG